MTKNFSLEMEISTNSLTMFCLLNEKIGVKEKPVVKFRLRRERTDADRCYIDLFDYMRPAGSTFLDERDPQAKTFIALVGLMGLTYETFGIPRSFVWLEKPNDETFSGANIEIHQNNGYIVTASPEDECVFTNTAHCTTWRNVAEDIAKQLQKIFNQYVALNVNIDGDILCCKA